MKLDFWHSAHKSLLKFKISLPLSISEAMISNVISFILSVEFFKLPGVMIVIIALLSMVSYAGFIRFTGISFQLHNL